MKAFGIQLRATEPQRFQTLRAIFYEVKKDKDAEEFRDPDEWVRLVPDDVKARFFWPSSAERKAWQARRPFTPIAISEPSGQLASTWDFYRVWEAIEEGDYSLLSCELVSPNVAEMRIDPNGYPYGGVGPLIALAEAFGFLVLGVNECGKFESRDDLLSRRSIR